MANFLDKFRIQTAAGRMNKFHFSNKHVTTSDFMQANVTFCRELIPNEHFSIDMNTFSRMAPMPVPTFGEATLNNRAFFVPYRTVFPQWDEFITDTDSPLVSGQGSVHVQKTPYLNIGDLTRAVVNEEFSEDVTQDVESNSDGEIPFDLYVMYDNTENYFKFREPGRIAFKLLNQLGYKLPTDLMTQTGIATQQVSALPLLCYCKAFMDWYWPSAYYNEEMRMTLESMFHQLAANGYQVTTQNIRNILWYCSRVCYDADPFVSAFDNPVGPTSGSYSDVVIPDVTNNSNDVGSRSVVVNSSYTQSGYFGTNGTPLLAQEGSSTPNGAFNSRYPGHISQFVVDSLKALTDYCSRHRLVGARALDRFLARYGIALNSEQANRSQYIGSNVIDMHITDVDSNTENVASGGEYLGSYAGKGLCFGQDGHFEYDANDFGLFVIISSITPKIGYYQGFDPAVFRLTRLQFFTPEFDGLGTEAIPKAQVYMPTQPNSSIQNSTLFSGVFAWQPRFASYKYMTDKVTGDYNVRSLSQSGDASDSWHLMRQFDNAYFSTNSDYIVHNRAFVQGYDNTQYNRIFYNQEDTADHFYLIFRFNVDTHAPMKSLYDDYDFESEGKKILMDVNGVKMN